MGRYEKEGKRSNNKGMGRESKKMGRLGKGEKIYRVSTEKGQRGKRGGERGD